MLEKCCIISIMENLFEKTVSSHIVYGGRIFNVKRDEVMLPNGSITSREMVSPKDGAVIAAELDGKVFMVKQFRYPAQDVLYELPAGKLDKEGESALDAAKRELEEETGYIADNWESLGYIWTTPGFCTERIYIFKASNLVYKGQHLDEDEFLDFAAVDKEKIFDMIQLGIINDAKSIAAVMRAYKL